MKLDYGTAERSASSDLLVSVPSSVPSVLSVVQPPPAPAAKRPAYRPKNLRKPLGPYRTPTTTFERGKQRQIDVTLHPMFVEVRLAGMTEVYRVTLEQLYLKGCANGAGFDPSARTGRITRGSTS